MKASLHTQTSKHEKGNLIPAHVPVLEDSAQTGVQQVPLLPCSLGHPADSVDTTIFYLVRRFSHSHYPNKVRLADLTLFGVA
ncbi:hypothetical protein [Cnuella takakiae]|uniref:hypothetical protein n=1 Tax=Cnuella takakiae TaxID=1302690 RepID=UPI00097AED54|nr:hypothetical protein [Cnuella takakiae]OLY94229.1 hypothetical protein BUE76_21840 [Cnuella takakiae]